VWRFLFIAFLIAHGVVHVAIWVSPRSQNRKAPFDPAHSWLVGVQRPLSIVLALVTAALLIGAGVGLWAHAEWWRPVAAISLAMSLVLMILYFNRWFVFIMFVNAGLIAGIVWLDWPSASMAGV
jgi:hypothetical protein